MATLTSPVQKQNLIDRFADYVRDTANFGISWGTNAYPFAEFSQTSIFGGTTAGKALEVSAASITDSEITAQTIYDTLLAETRRYTKIRSMRAVLFVDGGGGNTGSRPNPGIIYDQTAVAYLNDTYIQTITANKDNVVTGNTITSAGLESMFTNMRTAYTSARNTSAGTFQTNVCHASCHSSCHGSRGRR